MSAAAPMSPIGPEDHGIPLNPPAEPAEPEPAEPEPAEPEPAGPAVAGDLAITREAATILIDGQALVHGEILWGHRGASVEDVWLVGDVDRSGAEAEGQPTGWIDALSHGQDVGATVHKDGGVLVVRRARVLRSVEPTVRVRFWLSAADARHIASRWWVPQVTAAAAQRAPTIRAR